jgi:hypothetical protein
VVVARPHSGTRLLAGLFRAVGVFIGTHLTQPQLDSWSMHQRFVVPLLRVRLTAGADERQDAALDRVAAERFEAAWTEYAGGRAPLGPWGWKVCEAAFVMPAVRRLLPASVFVHVIRDGRDVVLTNRGYFQITAPTSDPPCWYPEANHGPTEHGRLSYRDFSRLVTFGETTVQRHWNGIDLDDPRDVVRHRYTLQMKAWLTAVTWARRDSKRLDGGYHEVRYEDLCTCPIDVARDLFRRLGLAWSTEAATFLDRYAVSTNIGLWQRTQLPVQESRDFARAVSLGYPVLRECGYVE